MKKVIALFLAILMTTSMLAGCNNGASSSDESKISSKSSSEATTKKTIAEKAASEPKNLVMWHSFTQGPRMEFMKNSVKSFYEKTGININIETYSWADFYTKWTAGVASNTVPDLSSSLPVQTAEMISIKALYPLNDLVEEIGKDKFFEGPLNEFFIGGKYYGIALYSNAYIMWYRKDLLKQAGLEVPKTWEELYQAALAIYKKTGTYGLSFPMASNDFLSTMFLDLYVSSGGKSLLTKDLKADLTNQLVLDGIAFWAKVYKNVSPKESINFKTLDQATLYYQGKVAFDFNTAFHINGVKTTTPALMDQIACAPIPKINTNDQDYGENTNNTPLVVWNASKSPNSAMQFIQYILEPDRYVDFVLSVPIGMIPTVKGVTETKKFMDNEIVKQFPDALKFHLAAVKSGTGIGMEYGAVPEASILTNQGIIEKMFQDIVTNGTDIAVAAKAAQDKINALMP